MLVVENLEKRVQNQGYPCFRESSKALIFNCSEGGCESRFPLQNSIPSASLGIKKKEAERPLFLCLRFYRRLTPCQILAAFT